MDINIFINEITHIPFNEVVSLCSSSENAKSYCMDQKYRENWKSLIDSTFSYVYNYTEKIKQFNGIYNYATYIEMIKLLDPITQLMVYFRQGDMTSFDDKRFTQVQKFLALFLLSQKDIINKYLPNDKYMPFVDLLNGKNVGKQYFDIMLSEMASKGNVLGVKYFIQNGGDINYSNGYNLELALTNNHIEVVNYLLEKGMDINMALLASVNSRNLEMVKKLHQSGADIQYNKNNPLQNAIFRGSLEIVKYLVENGVDINSNDGAALRVAARTGKLDIVKYLVEKGANIHVDNDYIFRNASHDGKLIIVQYLLENGANIHSLDDFALRAASENGHLEVVKYLVEKGADIHADNDAAVKKANQNNHTDIVQYLIEKGANFRIVKEEVIEYDPSLQPIESQIPVYLGGTNMQINVPRQSTNILNVYDVLHLPELSIDPKVEALRIRNSTISYKGIKYEGTINNPTKIGEGWNGLVQCCTSIDNNNVAIKYPKKKNDNLQLEFVIYDQLLKHFKFPLIPIIDRGSNYEFLLRPYKDPQYFGNKLNLDGKQREKLRNLWIEANRYALITGIPLDLSPANIWWDIDKLEWFLIDTGPRLDAGDKYQFAYTLNPSDADEYIETYFIGKKGENALSPQIILNINPNEVTMSLHMKIVAKFTKNSLIGIDVENYLEEEIVKYMRKDSNQLLKLYMKGILPTIKILEYARKNIEISKLLCEIHKICPNVPVFKEFKTEIDTISQLRNDTYLFHNNLNVEERKIFDHYTGSGYQSMNQCLRNNLTIGNCTPAVQNAIVALEKILERSDVPRTKNEIYVFRGFNPADTSSSQKFAEQLRNMKVGELYEDRAFISTSVQHPPSEFVGSACCMMIVKLPRETPAYYIGKDSSSSQEEEVILLPGTVFKLVEIRRGSKGTNYKGKIIDTFIFECASCLTNERYLLSKPPKGFNVRKRSYQLVDSVIGKDRLALPEFTTYNNNISETHSDVIRIMSWNVHEWRNAKKRETTQEINAIIQQINPDILGLQEVIKTNSFFPIDKNSCRADRGTYGHLYNSLIIYGKPQFGLYHSIDLGPYDRCAVKARFSYQSIAIDVINLHLEVKSPKDREVNITKLLNSIEFPELTIIMGDFNAYKREDYTEENYEKLVKIKESYGLDVQTIKMLEQAGYVDTYQIRANDLKIPITNIIPVNTTDKAGKVDFIFIHRTSKFKIDKLYTYYTDVSDHLPLIMDIKNK